VPIAFAPLRGEEASPQKIAAIVQADLERSGQFRGLNADHASDETARPDLSGVRQKGADALLTGSVSRERWPL
jgi:TolB protein